MNNKTSGKTNAAKKAPAAPGRPRKPTYSVPRPQNRDSAPRPQGREGREPRPDAPPDNRAEVAGRREQQATDRSAHKANLFALQKVALEAIRPLAAQVEALRQETARKDAIIDSLQKRLARLEASQPPKPGPESL